MGGSDDVERVEDALPAVDAMAEADGADLRQVGSERRCDHPHHDTRSSNGENLCISADDDVWHCKRHRHGGGKLAWVAMSAGVVGCGELQNGSIPRGLFRDVLEVAADRAGVELTDGPPVDDGERAHRAANDTARKKVAEFYHDCLDRNDMRDELVNRYGFTDELIDENLVGYAPPAGIDHDLNDATSVPTNVLQEIGVLTDGGGPHFRERFVFPYWERDRGSRRVRYFTARAVDHDGGPKYLKLPKDGPIDDEAAVEPPFGIDTVLGERTVVLTEGVTDALTLHDRGIAAVSPVTTHISGDALDSFARRLRGKNVYVVYDEDAGTNAGIQGAARDAHVLAGEGVGAEVARLPCRPNESIDVNEWFADGGDAETFRDDVIGGTTFPAGVAWWAWGNGKPWRVFSDAIDVLGYDPRRAVQKTDDDGNHYYVGVEDLVDDARSLAEARRRFYNSGKTTWSAATHKEAYHRVILWTFHTHGEFFKTGNGQVYYYHEPTNRVVPVASDQAPANADAAFAQLVADEFGITTAEWGRNLVGNVAREAVFRSPERPTGRLAYYDDDRAELYVNRFDGHYYALDGTSVELRRNGADVFFITDADAEPYTYLGGDERATLPEMVPGERPLFAGSGDTVKRLLCNRTNFDEHANLGPSLQRSQLYLHLHALAFVSEFDGKPIMAWVGQKGSGKTVVLRSIGQFIYGPEWSESTMPSERDDFVTKVSNQTVAAIDNYDDGEDWANDMLAAIATGASVEKRELYTTDTLASMHPECFLALTSRDPPFRRDDVADRCLVFRVDRVEGEFISETEYLKQVSIYRDELWSQYIDNLNQILQVRREQHDEHRTTSHRMADWAIFARDAADALDVGHVDELLGGMQTERAFFALENDPLRVVIEEWLKDTPDGGTYEASDLLTEWRAAAESAGVAWPYSSSRGLSSSLSSLSDELAELFDMDVITPRNGPKRYRFPGGGVQYLLDNDEFDTDGGDDA